jgi:hypothetical protein
MNAEERYQRAANPSRAVHLFFILFSILFKLLFWCEVCPKTGCLLASLNSDITYRPRRFGFPGLGVNYRL